LGVINSDSHPNCNHILFTVPSFLLPSLPLPLPLSFLYWGLNYSGLKLAGPWPQPF
jgi:hypothetical protein